MIRMDMLKTGNNLKEIYRSFGLLSRVTLLLLDEKKSTAPHDMYKERGSTKKVYKEYPVDALVDEMVMKSFFQRQVATAVGSRDNYDLIVYIFGDSPIDPQKEMKVRYRNQEIDVLTVNSWHSNDQSGQMGWALNCKRLS